MGTGSQRQILQRVRPCRAGAVAVDPMFEIRKNGAAGGALSYERVSEFSPERLFTVLWSTLPPLTFGTRTPPHASSNCPADRPFSGAHSRPAGFNGGKVLS